MFRIIFITTIGLFISARQSVEMNIVGLWQINTANVSSALHDTYTFYNDGSFIYDFDQYDDLNRIVEIGGKYYIDGHSLIHLTVLYRKELVGGRVVRGGAGFQKGWILTDAKQVRVNEQYSEEAAFEICDSAENQTACIKIDNEKFYKLSDNPDDPNFK